MVSLNGLELLGSLEKLEVSSNKLSDADEVLPVLSAIVHLRELDIVENPLMEQKQMRDRIIVVTKSLGKLTILRKE